VDPVTSTTVPTTKTTITTRERQAISLSGIYDIALIVPDMRNTLQDVQQKSAVGKVSSLTFLELSAAGSRKSLITAGMRRTANLGHPLFGFLGLIEKTITEWLNHFDVEDIKLLVSALCLSIHPSPCIRIFNVSRLLPALL